MGLGKPEVLLFEPSEKEFADRREEKIEDGGPWRTVAMLLDNVVN